MGRAGASSSRPGSTLVIWLLHALLDWPSLARELAIGATLFVPFALAVSSVETLAVRIDRLLVHTIEVGGVVVMVGAVYLLVVLGLGDAPDESRATRARPVDGRGGDRGAALRARRATGSTELANRRVYGERHAPDELLQTFGARMSRAIPLDELLLQLAESLKKTMQLAAAEVWTGTDGVLERAVSVPDRGPPRIRLGRRRGRRSSRARACPGNAWVQVWLPALLAAHDEPRRCASRRSRTRASCSA